MIFLDENMKQMSSRMFARVCKKNYWVYIYVNKL